MTVIGIEPVNYTSKKTGNPVSGTRLFVTFERKSCVGLASEGIFCNSRAFPDGVPNVGDEIRVFYNRFGQVDQVEICR